MKAGPLWPLSGWVVLPGFERSASQIVQRASAVPTASARSASDSGTEGPHVVLVSMNASRCGRRVPTRRGPDADCPEFAAIDPVANRLLIELEQLRDLENRHGPVRHKRTESNRDAIQQAKPDETNSAPSTFARQRRGEKAESSVGGA